MNTIIKLVLFITFLVMSSIGCAAGLTNTDIHGFDKLPESTKAEYIANISKSVDQYEAAQQTQKPQSVSTKSGNILVEAAGIANMTPDQFANTPTGSAILQYVMNKYDQHDRIHNIVGGSIMVFGTLIWLYLFRKIALVYQITTTPMQVGERIEYEKVVTYDRDNGGIQFLMIVFLILINIIGIIVFFN